MIPQFLARRLRDLLQDVAAESDCQDPVRSTRAGEAQQLLELIAPRRRFRKINAGPTLKHERRQKKIAVNSDTTSIREAVMKRANGLCEAPSCRQPFTRLNPAAMDHWLGGSGRRRQEQSEATCWMLCTMCDRARTANRPSAAGWNAQREEFCRLHGFPFQPHIEHQLLKRRGVAQR